MKATRIILLTSTLVLSFIFSGCYTTFAVIKHTSGQEEESSYCESNYNKPESYLQVNYHVDYTSVQPGPYYDNKRRDIERRKSTSNDKLKNIRRPSKESSRQSVAKDNDKSKSGRSRSKQDPSRNINKNRREES